jgi:hypothetical protein
MKKIVTLLACLLTGSMLRAQAVPMALEDWKTTQGTQNFFYKNITKTDPSGNVFVAGATMNNGFPDILVAKYNAAGNLQWIQQFAGTAPNGVDAAAGLYVNSTDVYITGTISNNSVTPETDCFTMKLSGSTGSILWSTTYSGAAGSHDAGKDITMDGSGNLYVTGASYNSSFNADYLVLKYNSSGTQQWVNTWDYTGADDGGYKIAISGTNVNVSGGVTTTTPGAYKMSTIKLTQSTGSITATSTSTAVTTSSVEAVTDMAPDGSGNVIIVGSRYSSGQHDFYVQKLNAATLASVFVYTWDGGSSLDDFAKAVTTDASGNVFVAGFSTSSTLGRELTLIKLNGSGTHQWTQTSGFNGDDEAADLITDASNNVYVTGYKTNGTKDYYTAKYSGSGTKVWEIEADGNSGLDDNVTNVALDALDHVVVTGQSKTGSGDYEFMTVKYAQKDVTRPTDFDGESPVPNFMYYRNRGQIIAADTVTTPVPEVKFYTNNTYPAFYFGNRKQSFVFARMDTASVSPSDTLHRIDLDFTLSNESAETYPLDEQQDGYLNYFLAHTGSNGIANVKGNERLITNNLYNNIDLMCSSNQNGIKYYFIVKPGGNIRDIQMEFTGASSFNLNGTTNELTINSSIGNIAFDKPIVYQLTSGNVIVPVSGWTPDWQTNGASNKYKFNDGVYTNSLTLVIEVDQGNGIFVNSSIQNIKWSTYLGKANEDFVNKVKTDATNNLHALGQTYSTNFPQNPNATVYNPNIAGSMDGFLARFAASGQLTWSTYVGGSKADRLTDLAFHSNGDIYCIGGTSSANITTVSKAGANNDATFAGPTGLGAGSPATDESLIFQLTPSGSICPWLRYYGGDGTDQLRACVMDGNDNFFVTGFSNSSDLPIIYSGSSYYQNNSSSGVVSPNSSFDGIIARFNSSSVVTWATYIGSSLPSVDCRDYIYDIVIGRPSDFPTADVFIVGASYGQNYPNVSTTGSSNYTTLNSPSGSTYGDIVITRFSNTGDMRWSTYAGGTGGEEAWAVDYGNDMLYVTGITNSSDFLSINSGTDYSQNTGGIDDAIFLKINSSNQIIHSTVIGGSDSDRGWDIVYDKVNFTAYISGMSEGPHLPIPSSNPSNTYNQGYAGAADNFICGLRDNSSSLLWATYLGGSNEEANPHSLESFYHQSLCMDGNNHLYLGSFTKTSETQVNPFPLDNGGGNPVYFQPSLDGVSDGTITKFDLIPVNLVSIKEKSGFLNEASIYPNPARDALNDKWKDKSGLAYKIINAVGQVVVSGNLLSGLNTINIQKLAPGFYIIELNDANSKISTKFIKHE